MRSGKAERFEIFCQSSTACFARFRTEVCEILCQLIFSKALRTPVFKSFNFSPRLAIINFGAGTLSFSALVFSHFNERSKFAGRRKAIIFFGRLAAYS